jgi:hypothetical protein
VRASAPRPPPPSVRASTPTPIQFDWREENPTCIHPIRDQGKCGSCWANAGSEVLSDRFCIHSNGSINVILSPLYMMQCDKAEHGCQGGYPEKAWKFLAKQGTYSEDCDPYNLTRQFVCPLSQCADHSPLRNRTNFKAQQKESYQVMGTVEEEIVLRGPVEAVFSVYPDFMHYAGGIYHHNTSSKDKPLGEHAVKLVGFGVANLTVSRSLAASLAASLGNPPAKQPGPPPDGGSESKHDPNSNPGPPDGSVAIRTGSDGGAVGASGDIVTAEVQYWIAANSWNASWGENGTLPLYKILTLTLIITITT